MKFLDKNIKRAERMCKHICVIGAGSVGSVLALFLARLTNRLTIIDFDTIESHNISTHFLAFALLSKETSKSYAIKLTIDSFMLPCKTQSIVARGEEIDWNQVDAKGSIEYIVICTDTVESRVSILNNIYSYEFPSLQKIIDTGVSTNGWRITVLEHNEIPSYLTILNYFPERREDAKKSCEQLRNITVISSLVSKILEIVGGSSYELS